MARYSLHALMHPHAHKCTHIHTHTGTPNTPIVVFGNGPTFQWQTDEEDEARPVDCHYGNVTVRTPEGSENVVQFDFCDGSDGPGSEFDLPDFDTSNMYTVIVCSRNRLGTSCTEPLIHTPPPPTIALPTTTPPPTTIAVPGMTGLQSGAIVGIVVGVLLGCCLIWLLLLLLLLLCCCCKGNREKRYFPQKRGEYVCVVNGLNIILKLCKTFPPPLHILNPQQVVF